jgi:hypothetical protein
MTVLLRNVVQIFLIAVYSKIKHNIL